MSEIVERLRLLVPSDSSGAAFDGVNEIARLTSENEKLRAALTQIAGIDPWDDGEQGYVDKARAALSGDKHE